MHDELVVQGLCLGGGLLLLSGLAWFIKRRRKKTAKKLTLPPGELPQMTLNAHLPARRNFKHYLEKIVDQARFHNQSFSVFIVSVADTELSMQLTSKEFELFLAEVQQRILHSVAEEQTVLSRLEGDEFAFVSKLTDYKALCDLANDLIMAVSSTVQIANKRVLVECNVGIALCPDHGLTSKDIINSAASALYKAVAIGRNQYFIAGYSSNQIQQQVAEFVREMHVAIEENHFFLEFQPKFNSWDGGIFSFEALTRWQHPERGVIAPAQFIPTAEKYGAIICLGHWIIKNSLRQLRYWQDLGFANIKISINISAAQLLDANFVSYVRWCLNNFNVPAENVILEVTESVAMHDMDLSIKTLNSLSNMGIMLAIDDFGTGYSSLLYLRYLPTNILKIDQGFIANLKHGSPDAMMVSSIITLAHSFNMSVVAEGVETLEQKNFLENLGCDYLQGFLFGKPLNATDATRLLNNHHQVKADANSLQRMLLRATPEENYQLFMQTLEQAIDGIVVINENNQVIIFNQAAEQLWGYAKHEILAQPMEQLIPPSLQQEFNDFVEQNRVDQSQYSGQRRVLQIIRKDRSLLTCSLSFSKVVLCHKVLYTAFIRELQS